MSRRNPIVGLSVSDVFDRVQRDVLMTGDSLSIARAIGLHRAELVSDRWTELIAAVSTELGMRASRGEGVLDEAAEWAMLEMPVVLSVGEGGDRRYVIIHDRQGGRLLVTMGPDPHRSDWIGRRELENRFGLHRDERTTWMAIANASPASRIDPADHSPVAVLPGIGSRPAAGHSHDAGHGHGHAAISPQRRLLQIIRPEMTDIRAIGVYALATSILGLATPLAVESLVATVGFKMLLQQVVVLSVVLFGFLSLAAAFFTIQKYVVEVIQRRIFVRVVADLAFRLPRVRLNAYDTHNGPELVNRFFDVMTMQKTLAGLLTDGVYLLITTVIGLSVMGFYHPYLLGFDVVLLASIVFIILVMGRGGVRTAINESIAKYEMAAWLQELARLPRTTKHYGGADLAIERADALARNYLDARRSHFRIVYRQVLFTVMLQVAASTALLGLGGWLVIDGQLTLGQLVASELIVALVVGSFAKMGKHIEDFYDLVAAADKIGHLIDLPVEPISGEPVPAPMEPSLIEAAGLKVIDPHGHTILGPLDLTFKPGEKVGLAGTCGSGKSTLLDVLAGQRDYAAGSVRFDGLELKDALPESYRRQVAYVSAEPAIFGSLLDNIRVGREGMSLREVRWALKVVGLEHKFSHSEHGLSADVGLAGQGLSLGEAARLAIARAIVGQPRLLLIDGGLDLLDSASREKILEVLLDPSASWTMVLATQAPEILAKLDRVVTLPGRTESHHSQALSIGGH
jgi:ABC-type bacteriocin/lantibiotic exporter with double-glycine peptidase domain